MSKARKQYSSEYVRLLTEGGLSVVQAARDLGVNENILHRWKRELAQHVDKAFPGQDLPIEAELVRLRREVEVLKQEREIKKSREYLLATVPLKYAFI